MVFQWALPWGLALVSFPQGFEMVTVFWQSALCKARFRFPVRVFKAVFRSHSPQAWNWYLHSAAKSKRTDNILLSAVQEEGGGRKTTTQKDFQCVFLHSSYDGNTLLILLSHKLLCWYDNWIKMVTIQICKQNKKKTQAAAERVWGSRKLWAAASLLQISWCICSFLRSSKCEVLQS